MNVRIQRIEVDEYNSVKAIEFYIESDPIQVIEFLQHHKIGREFLRSAEQGNSKPDMSEYIRAGVEAKYPNLSREYVDAIAAGRIDANSIPTDAVLSNHLTDIR